ncbi:MAG: transporter substrate-binding domain-containing protein [Gammaproteobacteria bacterium]|nr:transporter substrate-binding domain-containing protein [Gammaproteobacteria bacterium]
MGDGNRVRVGLLKFGTVNWEMDVIRTHGLADREGIELEVRPLASVNAINVALQAGAVDIIVNDWIWTSRQRAVDRDYTFVPYSQAVGSLMVHPDSGVNKLGDLRDKRLGIAGGPVDKSWLLLQVYARKTLDAELSDLVEPVFAAPPLLNQLMLDGDLSAALNFWHYGARLQAAGMEPLLGVADILPVLGVDRPIPLLGWVFSAQWAEKNPKAIDGFLRASRAAKQLLAESDEEWERLRPLVKAEDEPTLHALRDGYRAGIPQCFGEPEVRAARQVFEIMAQEGGKELVGSSNSLSTGTFWEGYQLGTCPQ